MENRDAQSAGPAQRPMRRRRWGPRLVIAGVVLGLGLVIVFLPAFTGSPLGRPILLAYVNRQLNGRAEIRDCSLGWFHGMRIDGLVVFDAENRQILQAARVTTALSFLDILRGRYRVGSTHAHRLDVLISRDAGGSLNWDRLLRGDSVWRSPAAHVSLSGELSVVDGSCTYEDQSGEPPVFLRAVSLQISMPGGDHPATDGLSADARIGSRKSGSIHLTGEIDRHAGTGIHATQHLTTDGLDPSIVSQRLGPAWRLVERSDRRATFEFGRAEPGPSAPKSRPAGSGPAIDAAPR